MWAAGLASSFPPENPARAAGLAGMDSFLITRIGGRAAETLGLKSTTSISSTGILGIKNRRISSTFY